MKILRNLGPGFLVTAAFIGPGTVTLASRAGATFGFSLLWTVVFSVIAAITLQEMAARLGLVTKQGLGEAIRNSFANPVLYIFSCLLILIAIGFGNAAYQTGNLIGAAQGLRMLLPVAPSWWVLLIAAAAFGLLWTGHYKAIEWTLIALVIIMSLLFVITAAITRPSLSMLANGLFVPSFPAGSLTTIIGLIGTTVVPYNLFLHADAVREKRRTEQPLPQALTETRVDTFLSVSLGGVITVAIIVTAAVAFAGTASLQNLSDIAAQLEPLLGGPAAKIAFAIGLFAAGLTSSITAPLAAAYAVCGVLGLEKNLRSWYFRAVWMIILVTGVGFAIAFGSSPGETITVAQVANGFLLPIIAIFLLVVVNRRRLMGEHCNRLWSNVAGICVVAVAVGLGLWKIVAFLIR